MKQITHIINYALAGIALLAVSSCATSDVEQPTINRTKRSLTIDAQVNSNPESRIQFNDDPANKKLALEWDNEGEEFSLLYIGDSFYTEIFRQIAGTSKFTGDIPGPDNTEVLCYEVTAIYPQLDIDGSVLSYDISQQNGDLESKNIMMVGYASNNGDSSLPLDANATIDFQNIVSILKPKFTLDGNSINSDIESIKVELPARATSLISIDAWNGTVSKKNHIDIDRSTLSEDIYITLLGTFGDTLVDSTANVAPIAKNEVLKFIITTTNGDQYRATLTANKDLQFSKIYTATIPVQKYDKNYTWYLGIEPSSPEEILLTGDGSEDDPFEIHTANDLQLFIDCYRHPEVVIDKYGEEAAKALATSHFRLTHDLTIESSFDAPWTPIGMDTDRPFMGTFDGYGHTIYGEMNYDGSNDVIEDEYSIYGFFGVNAGTIKNLNIAADLYAQRIHPTIMTGINDSDSSLGGAVAGGVAGIAFDGNIINCTNSGNIYVDYDFTANDSDCTLSIGGIVGICGTSTEVNSVSDLHIISGCTNSGTISMADHTRDNGRNLLCFMGGITGAAASMIIQNCTNTGNIYGGDARDQMAEGFEEGNISVTVSSGICAWSAPETAIISCENYGDIYGGDACFTERRMSMTVASGICGANQGVIAGNTTNYGKVIEGVGGEDVGYIPPWNDETNSIEQQPATVASSIPSRTSHSVYIDNPVDIYNMLNNKTRITITINLYFKEHTAYGNIALTNEGFICTCTQNLNGDDGYLCRWGNYTIGDTTNLSPIFQSIECTGTH